MKQLLFKGSPDNPLQFKEGARTTCRQGIKWLEVPPGTEVEIVDLGGNRVIGTGSIVGAFAKVFKYLTDAEIAQQHSDQTSTREGLLAAMKSAYADFSENDIVTMVTFDMNKRVK